MGIIEAILCGSVGAAVVAGVFGVVMYRMKRRDEVADRADAKEAARVETLKKQHENDIADIKHEQAILVYGMLACLKGLQKKGCDGPVTEAINTLEKHLNYEAHKH